MEKTVEERVVNLEAAYDFVGKELAGLRADLGEVETTLRDDMRQGFGDLRAEIGRVDTKLDGKLDTRIGQAEANLRAEIGKVETRIGQVDTNLRAEIGKVDTNLRNEIKALDTRVYDVQAALRLQTISLIAGFVGIVATVVLSAILTR
jgi:hypothetical protein